MKKQVKSVLALLFFSTVAISFFAYHNADEYRLNSILKKEELRNGFIKTYLEVGGLTWNNWHEYFPPREESFLCERIKLKKPLVKKEMVTVVATAYCKVPKGVKNYHAKVKMNGEGKRTAFGTVPKRGTIAADTRIFPRGTILFIPGYGRGIVDDRGGDIKNHRIDLFMGSGKDAYADSMEWGRQRISVKIIKLARR